ncbi:MAG TPA: hypothetical protein VLL52_25720 [Anaerolineae bacterium]|nr:hypothetical protein [Anaerolineae bacterium]
MPFTNFPSIFDWLERFAPYQGMPAVYMLLATAILIVIFYDWRLLIASLATQYFFAALLFATILDPRLATIKLLTGWFICLMLYITARQINWGQLPPDVAPHDINPSANPRWAWLGPVRPPLSLPFRILLTLIMALTVWVIGQNPQYKLPNVPDLTFNLAIFALLGLGLLGLGLTTEPLKAGLGLLMFITGFELFYNGSQQSIALLLFLTTSKLFLTLVICYLVQIRYNWTRLLT